MAFKFQRQRSARHLKVHTLKVNEHMESFIMTKCVKENIKKPY